MFWQTPDTTWDLGRVLRPAYFIPESKKISDLLRDLVERKTRIAIAADERRAKLVQARRLPQEAEQ